MKILFIEDQEELNAIGSIQLEDLGHKVFSVFSVWEARDIYAKHKEELDLIIADHRLPDGLGIAFLEVLRESGCSIPSAVVSGCLTLDEQEDLARQGIPFFLKPVLYSDVLSHLIRKKVVSAFPAHRAVPAAAESTPHPARYVEEDEEDGMLAGTPSREGFLNRIFRLVS
ncbi:MAG: response regulator [Opitutales bacterium]|nr:response regulator [Opitutales bacterium]